MLRAREAAGQSRSQLASITKIPERHLAAIEAGDFASLPARTYAVGFARNYARAVGLDQNEIAEAVRAELAAQAPQPPRRTTQSFEPGDPARVPGASFAWLSLAAGLAVILAGFAFFWRGYYMPGGELPSILAEETAAPAASPAPAANPAADRAVVFTALEPLVWVKFVDGVGNQLFQKELLQGESYTVPAGIGDVRLTTARPTALAITVGGQPVARLADEDTTLREVPVTAAALLARGTPIQAAPAIAAPKASASARPPRREPPRAAPTGTATPTPEPAAAPAPVPSATSAADS
ncbi:MAG: helix-turn-helix domain-containing protein [Novosphingobium sp.]